MTKSSRILAVPAVFGVQLPSSEYLASGVESEPARGHIGSKVGVGNLRPRDTITEAQDPSEAIRSHDIDPNSEPRPHGAELDVGVDEPAIVTSTIPVVTADLATQQTLMRT